MHKKTNGEHLLTMMHLLTLPQNNVIVPTYALNVNNSIINSHYPQKNMPQYL